MRALGLGQVIAAGIVFSFAVCAGANVSAQTQQQHDWCYDDKATDDQTIEGCTALIDSHTLSGRELAIVLFDRGLSYENTSKYPLAVADFSQAVALDPNYADAFDDRGNVFFKLSQNAQAIQDFNEAIRLKPDFALAYSNRGYVYYVMGNLDQAIEDLNRSISLDANQGRAYVNRALTEVAKKDCTDAVQDYLHAKRLNWKFTLSDSTRAACGSSFDGLGQ